jgi:hypothetical protein
MGFVGRIIGYVPKVFKYTTRMAKASPYIIFGDAANAGAKEALAVTRAEGQSWGSVFRNMSIKGLRGVEDSVAASKKAANGGFFKAMWNSIKEVPSIFKGSINFGAKRAIVAAKAAGKGPILSKLAGVWGGTKGFFKGIGKKMPLIGNILLIAFELPNIYEATKDKGILQGGIEVAKAGARLTVASLAAAAGSAVAGPIGGIVGFMVGDWVTSKIVGKSYTEEKAEKEEQTAEDMARLQELAKQQELIAQTQAQAPAQQVSTPQPQVAFNGASNPFQQMNYPNSGNPYANDFMMQSINFDALA